MAYPRYREPVYRPPSEANSLVLQITIGCSQNHCRFCGMYKHKRYTVRELPELLGELDGLPHRYKEQVTRVFLADGDALAYPFDGLMVLLQAFQVAFPRLQRVSSYASPKSLAEKTQQEMQQLRAAGLRLLYLGLESGDPETLAISGKGYHPDEVASLAMMARRAGMKLSVTAILGLGGRARSSQHAKATADWVNLVNPEFFSLLTLFVRHNDAFLSSLERMTVRDIFDEVRRMLEDLHPCKTILRSNHVSNLITLAGSYPKDRERLLADLRRARLQAEGYPGLLDSIPDYAESM